MFVLKIIKGEDTGKYVGKIGAYRSMWKPQESIDKARIFTSIAAIKNFFGKRYARDGVQKVDEEYEIHRDVKKRNKDRELYRIPYTKYYEVIEININIK